MSSTNQLFLLSDHIKLSLLERQRAKSLHIDEEAGTGGDSDAAHQQDGHISRSLDQFREGLASLQAQVSQLEESGDATYVI
jgi:syntaxin 8